MFMQLAEALRILKDHEADLKMMGVRRLYMFGSTTRGAQRPDSDVDLFFDYEPGALTLFELMEIEEKASELLGCKADITTRDSIHPLIRQQVERAALQVF
jgi:uncharacterized protein